GQLACVGQVVLENRLHVLGHTLVEDLHVDLVVADQAQTVHVGGTDGAPPTVHGGRLGVHHRVLVQPQPHTTTQQHLVLSTGQPIGEDVVGVLRKQDVDVHPTARGLDQGALEFPVGDEVG